MEICGWDEGTGRSIVVWWAKEAETCVNGCKTRRCWYATALSSHSHVYLFTCPLAHSLSHQHLSDGNRIEGPMVQGLVVGTQMHHEDSSSGAFLCQLLVLLADRPQLLTAEVCLRGREPSRQGHISSLLSSSWSPNWYSSVKLLHLSQAHNSHAGTF